ncbi:MAG: magnesium/cobalt transporter CorA [Beijerinckiaceae bacterium]
MLKLESLPGANDVTADLSADRLPQSVGWIDLCEPSDSEIAYVERATGLRVPRIAELVEIETSSRLRVVDGALYLSMPTVFKKGDETGHTPLGFVLTPKILITVRFEELRSFADVRQRLAAVDHECTHPIGVFIAILEAVVDRIADVLETVETNLDAISKTIFRDEVANVSPAPRRENRRLRGLLQSVGHAALMTSNIRDCLLGLGRIVPYVENHATDWLSSEGKQRLEVVRQDVMSLDDYKTHLTDKIQFLLDATLGLTNIDQNNIFRILTVVSIVGIPPTLFASIYGMNFKNMPELSWEWGYPFGLGVIVLSALIPILWFKVKGWL